MNKKIESFLFSYVFLCGKGNSGNELYVVSNY